MGKKEWEIIDWFILICIIILLSIGTYQRNVHLE